MKTTGDEEMKTAVENITEKRRKDYMKEDGNGKDTRRQEMKRLRKVEKT